jgi:hypothetical protein
LFEDEQRKKVKESEGGVISYGVQQGKRQLLKENDLMLVLLRGINFREAQKQANRRIKDGDWEISSFIIKQIEIYNR